MSVNRLLAILLIALSFSVSVSAQQTPRAYSLVLDTGVQDAMPRVYARSQDGRSWLLWDEDALSSGWFLDVENALQSPVDDGWTRTAERDFNMQAVIYTSRSLTFRLEAKLSTDRRYVKMSASVTFTGTGGIRVRPGVLVDTILGEATGLPFSASGEDYISTETVYSSSSLPVWIKSSRDAQTPSLTLFPQGAGSVSPEHLFLANWMRLKEGGTRFSPEPGRSFDNLPFSQGDSAVQLLFPETTLNTGESETFAFIVGLDEIAPGADDFVVRQAAPGVDTETENTRLRDYAVRQRIRELDAAIASIDELLENNGNIPVEDVVEMENFLKDQERFLSEYENL